MGRPPLGKTAMSDAERQRRHRAKLGAGPKKPVAGADPAALLSMSMQQRLEAFQRQFIRQQAREFEAAVQAEARNRIEATIRDYNETAARYQAVIKARRGLMDRATYLRILSCLHTDSRKSASDAKLNAAFQDFSRLQLVLLDEKQHPTGPARKKRDRQAVTK